MPARFSRKFNMPLDLMHNCMYNNTMVDNLIVNGKTRITIRIDNDVLEWFRSEVEAAGAGNYQTLINRALREFINGREQLDEAMLRRVIREELSAMRSMPATYKSNTTLSR
jgi:uncharacterized protein (DUF4415 family)